VDDDFAAPWAIPIHPENMHCTRLIVHKASGGSIRGRSFSQCVKNFSGSKRFITTASLPEVMLQASSSGVTRQIAASLSLPSIVVASAKFDVGPHIASSGTGNLFLKLRKRGEQILSVYLCLFVSGPL
jgi:hypothetical protein